MVGGRLSAKFRGLTGEVAVEVRTGVGTSVATPRLTATSLTTRGCADEGDELYKLVRVTADLPEVLVEIDSNAYCTLPRAVPAGEPDPARSGAAALESSRTSRPIRQALPHAMWLLGAWVRTRRPFRRAELN